MRPKAFNQLYDIYNTHRESHALVYYIRDIAVMQRKIAIFISLSGRLPSELYIDGSAAINVIWLCIKNENRFFSSIYLSFSYISNKARQESVRGCPVIYI